MSDNKEAVQQILAEIPSVDKLLQHPQIRKLREQIRYEYIKIIVQESLAKLREEILAGKRDINEADIYEIINRQINEYIQPSLKKVINATGIVLNTNLGRAPLGESLFKEILPTITGYNNLEFDLESGRRGSRHSHLKGVLRLLTGCEDSTVVNNNAAALFLSLKTLTAGKQVIISRGELVEIGGSFRIPEIVSNSGAEMVEVGTTNKTKLKDYENAITENCAAILKVHKSNYYIKGFTEEVSVKEISSLAAKHKLLSIYDLGTGLADINLVDKNLNEPDIKSVMKAGADIVTFSCDKLLGGPQAGIIAGKKQLIAPISKHPLMRVLRVDKLIIASLYETLRTLLYNDEKIRKNIPIFRYLNRDEEYLTKLANQLKEHIKSQKIEVKVVANQAYCGGGTLPDFVKESKAVLIEPKQELKIGGKDFAEKLYYSLLALQIPVVAILREGKLLFDVLTLNEEEVSHIANSIDDILLAFQSD